VETEADSKASIDVRDEVIVGRMFDNFLGSLVHRNEGEQERSVILRTWARHV
jgi:hypothetical protein